MTNKIHFDLSRELKYASGGEEVSTSFLELHEPTGNIAGLCMHVESMITSASARMASSLDIDPGESPEKAAVDIDSPEEAAKPSADDVLALLMASGVEMDKLVSRMNSIFCRVAYMGGEKLVTENRLRELSLSDTKKMIGTYIASFILS